MMRSAIAGISILALSLAACSPPAPTQTATPATVAEKPAPALEDKYATSADGTKIHYVASGEGPLVVMIHGFPDFSGSWSKLIPALNDCVSRVAVDTRGYNLSGQPEGVANYAMPKLVEDIDAVITAEGRQKATVIGHDWGAAIAWNYAFAHMDKLDNLVIMSVPHPANFGRQLSEQPAEQRLRPQLPEGRFGEEPDRRRPRRLGAGSRDEAEIHRGVQAIELRGDDELLSRQLSGGGQRALDPSSAELPEDRRAAAGDPRHEGSGAAFDWATTTRGTRRRRTRLC